MTIGNRLFQEVYLLRHEHGEVIRDVELLKRMMRERIAVSYESILRGEKKDPPGYEWENCKWLQIAQMYRCHEYEWLKFSIFGAPILKYFEVIKRRLDSR